MNEKLCKQLRRVSKIWDGYQGHGWKALYKQAKKDYRMARLASRTDKLVQPASAVLDR